MKKSKPDILWTLFRLWLAWRQFPQMRLGQLIENATRKSGRPTLFYMHDEDLVTRVEALVTVAMSKRR